MAMKMRIHIQTIDIEEEQMYVMRSAHVSDYVNQIISQLQRED